MKFERLDENKIRITFTVTELKEKNINFHDFMSSPLETQSLFLDILEEAKERIGFNTTNYKVKIEALAMVDGNFIMNITRIMESNAKQFTNQNLNTNVKKKVVIRRKKITPRTDQAIYKFNSFDDYCYFIQYIEKNNLKKAYLIAKRIVLYLYKNSYYLILDNINVDYKELSKFNTSITEFASYIDNSMLFISKLCECGSIIMKDNALKTSIRHFSTKSN